MIKNLLENKIIACFAAVFCTLLWGTAFPFIKLGYSEFEIADGDIGTKLLFAGFRFAIAGIMVYAVLCVLHRGAVTLPKRELLPVGILGLVQTAAQYIFTYIGIGFTSGTNTSVITACASFFTVIAVPFFVKEDRLGVMKIIGCLLGFTGVLVVNIEGTNFGADTVFGNLMILMSTVSAAAGNIVTKKITVGKNPIKITAFQLMIGGGVLIAAGFVCGGRLACDDFSGMMILIWLAFVSAAAFSIWTALLKYHNASKISVFNLLVPVFGTVLSGIMLGEDVFRIEILISLILISAGIACVNLSGTFCESR